MRNSKYLKGQTFEEFDQYLAEQSDLVARCDDYTVRDWLKEVVAIVEPSNIEKDDTDKPISSRLFRLAALALKAAEECKELEFKDRVINSKVIIYRWEYYKDSKRPAYVNLNGSSNINNLVVDWPIATVIRNLEQAKECIKSVNAQQDSNILTVWEIRSYRDNSIIEKVGERIL